MKGIWKIFEFEKFDILVTRSYCEKENMFTVEISLCPEPGNTATVSLQFESKESADNAFDEQTSETVKVFADYIIDSMGGNGIFEDDGPDEIEITLS